MGRRMGRREPFTSRAAAQTTRSSPDTKRHFERLNGRLSTKSLNLLSLTHQRKRPPPPFKKQQSLPLNRHVRHRKRRLLPATKRRPNRLRHITLPPINFPPVRHHPNQRPERRTSQKRRRSLAENRRRRRRHHRNRADGYG